MGIALFTDLNLRAVGQRVRATREARGMSRATLATLSNVHLDTIVGVETGRGRQGCTIGVLYRLAMTLGASADDWLGLRPYH